MPDILLQPNAGHFETAEFAEWLNLDGALEALSPTPRSPDSHISPNPLGNICLSGIEVNPQAAVAGGLNTRSTPLTVNKKRKAYQINGKRNRKTAQLDGKKTSHNVIEKRYRSNLNDKIAILRESIPTLRSPGQQVSAKEGSSDSDGSTAGDGSGSRAKFNKATVLTKATEYIKQLEKQNGRLREENSLLRNRLHGSQRVYSSSTVESLEQRSPSNTSMTDVSLLHSQVEKVEGPSSSLENVEGMIKVPDEFRRLWVGASQEHYAPTDEINVGTRGRFMSRLLLGSLATLMVMEGLSENETDRNADQPGSRGLFALPRELLTESRGFREPIRRRIIAFISSMQGHQVSTLSKLILLTVLLFGLLVYILEFAYRPLHRQSKSSSRLTPPTESSVLSELEHLLNQQTPCEKSATLVQDLPQQEETALNITIRRFFARQAVRLLGHSWLQTNVRDEESASIPSLRAEDFRRRWKAYADLLPKFLEESHAN